MTYAYNVLVKDKEIIAAQVMHEYNEGVGWLPVFQTCVILMVTCSLCTLE